MKCSVVETCENEATQRFTWAWGQEGTTCDEHRPIVEAQSTQLQRVVSWAPLGEPATDPGRRAYKRPTLQPVDPELGQLRMRLAERSEELKAAHAYISQLELRIMQLETELQQTKEPPAPGG